MSNNKNQENEVVSDEINLFDIFLVLWRKRGKIITWSVIFTVIVLAVGGSLFLFQNKYNVSELNFSLNFSGLSKGQYPNGSRFSYNDLISNTVLRKVYKENSLDKFFNNFSDFQNSLSVFRDDFMLNLLRSEYAGKFDNKKLTVEERDKLESDFKRRKKEILASSNYSLILSSGFEKEKLPKVLVSKILTDILKVWLNDSIREKGINKYQISLVTSDLISKEDIEGLDYIIGVDLLRETAKTISRDIEKISSLPGAKIVSIETQSGKTNLSNLRFRLNFIRQFELEPLQGAIRSYGITKEGPLSMIYLKTKLYELEREQKAIVATKEMYSESLSSYSNATGSEKSLGSSGKLQQGFTGNNSTIIPQFDGTFFDRIVNMAQQDANVKFRQKLTTSEISAALSSIDLEKEISYYNTLYNAFQKFKEASKTNSVDKKKLASVENLITQKQTKVLNSFIQIINDTHLFYDKINEYSLNPQSEFYSVSSFTVNTLKSLSLKKVILGMVIVWILLEVLLLAFVLLGNKINKSK